MPSEEATAASWPKKPGPNCPIEYTVNPDREGRDNCVRALRELAKLPSSPEIEELKTRGLAWLDQWHRENDRLAWNYTTLRYGLSNPDYAPKFQAFHEDYRPLRFLRAPNQVGKSYAAAAEVYFYATGRHPWRTLPGKWSNPGIAKTILIVTGSDQNREGVFQALWNLCPIDQVDWIHTVYDTRNMWGKHNPIIVFKHTNTKIIFRASNQDTDSLNSLTVDGIWIDEPPKAGTIDEIRRAGLARRAWVIMSFTPVGALGEDFTWLRDYVEGDEDYRDTGIGQPPRGQWQQYVIGIPDCPWFSPEELEIRRETYTEEQTPQRLYGEWDSAVIDRAFTHYRETGDLKTVLDRWHRETHPSPERVQYAVGIDHGEKAQTQVAVLIAYTTNDTLPAVILAEYVSKQKTTAAEDAVGIVEMLASVGLRPSHVTLWVGDINTGGKEAKGESLNRLLQRALPSPGGHIRIPNKYPGSVETEERRMNAAFKERRLLIHSRCKILMQSFRRYRGDGSPADKKLKHSLDAARYALQTVLDRMQVCMLYSHEYAGVRKLANIRPA